MRKSKYAFPCLLARHLPKRQMTTSVTCSGHYYSQAPQHHREEGLNSWWLLWNGASSYPAQTTQGWNTLSSGFLPSVTSWGLEIRSLEGSRATVAREVVAPDSSLIGSLRLVSGTLSRELNLTRELDRELRSGLVSDKPGMSSIFVGVTMNRTEDILAVASGGCIFPPFRQRKKKKLTKTLPPTLATFDCKNRKLERKKKPQLPWFTSHKGPIKNPST